MSAGASPEPAAQTSLLDVARQSVIWQLIGIYFAVMLAVKWLAAGASIQQVAADLGYESVPSFVTMFRKTLGMAPGRYMAERFG